MGTAKELAMPTSTLPNGLSVQHVSTQDLRFLYEEVFVQKCYLQHGLQLRPGDTVLDIGAHVVTHARRVDAEPLLDAPPQVGCFTSVAKLHAVQDPTLGCLSWQLLRLLDQRCGKASLLLMTRCIYSDCST